MYLVKLRPSGEKVIRDRLFIWGGLEQRKDGRKEGQEMWSSIMQPYEQLQLPVRQPVPDHSRWSRTIKQNCCSWSHRKSYACFCGPEDQGERLAGSFPPQNRNTQTDNVLASVGAHSQLNGKYPPLRTALTLPPALVIALYLGWSNSAILSLFSTKTLAFIYGIYIYIYIYMYNIYGTIYGKTVLCVFS